MGRVALGAAKKSKTGSVRVTETEYDWFEQRFGGLGKFLQAKVTEELAKAQPERCTPDRHTDPHRGCILR